MNEESSLKSEIQKMIKKGEDALMAAEVLLEKGLSDQASGRAYYSVFHFIQAALITKGLSYKKHSGVLSGFSLHFIKTGIFPKEFASDIRSLRRDREVGDYGYVLWINKEEAEDNIETARKIVKEVKVYLMKYLQRK